jgi:hypothetical protein
MSCVVANGNQGFNNLFVAIERIAEFAPGMSGRM